MKRLGRMAGAIAMMSALLLAAAGTSPIPAIASPGDAGSRHTSGFAAARETNAQKVGEHRRKGRPTVGPRSGASEQVSPLLGTSSFRYGEAHQKVRADGARGYYTVEKPIVAAGDYHSLAELAVSDATSQQIVEIGWTVDRGLYGDSDPHLFVFHWVDGEETCYNGCGFVPRNEPGYAVGMKLPVGATPVQFSILHRGTEWLLGYNRHWVGSFPDALWNNRFKVTGWVQWFGEVSAYSPTPCTDMGNGQFAASPTAARVHDVGFWPGSLVPNLEVSAPTPTMYTAVKTGAARFRYGGAGDCRTVPSLIGALPSTANRAITGSGLVIGDVGTIVDPLCEDIGHVLSQTPSTGTEVAGGSAMTYKYGVEPRNGCPSNRP